MERIAFAFSLVLVVLLGIGFFVPSGLLWGFHFLGFLPPYVFVITMVAGVAGLFVTYKGLSEQLFDTVLKFVEERPILFLSLTCGLFIIVATLLRVRVPLLGDSFILLNNYEFTFNGDHSLNLFRSPLAFGYFYAFANIFNTPVFPQILDAFLVGELLLGIVFIISTFFITRVLFENIREQVFSFCFLLILPYMQLFFGYAELYAIVLTTLSLFILLSLLYLKGKIPFYLLPPVYVLLYLANYLNIILLPALLFTGYLEFKNGKKLTLLYGLLLSGLVVAIALAFVQFDVQRFLQSKESGHWLSFSQEPGDQFQAYPIFSVYHFTDLLNITILLGGGAVFFVSTIFYRKGSNTNLDAITGFFISVTLLFLGFIAVVKLDLGFASDWDISAPYFFVLNVFALRLFFQSDIGEKIRSGIYIAVASLLISFSWFLLNSGIEPPLQRTEVLLDRRITSPSGVYQSMFHTSMYYHHTKQYNKQIDVWKRYTAMNPKEVRGLQNLAKSCYEGGELYDSLSVQTYERLLILDTTRSRHRIDYANFLAERGLMNYHRKGFTTAERQLKQALTVNPNLTSAYNNLASLFLDTQRPDSSIDLCKKAISMNPSYTLSYHNLANAYAQKSELDSAIYFYQKAISIDEKYIPAYENMSRAYYRKGDRVLAMETLREAARLGSKTAQSLLSMSGLQW